MLTGMTGADPLRVELPDIREMPTPARIDVNMHH